MLTFITYRFSSPCLSHVHFYLFEVGKAFRERLGELDQTFQGHAQGPILMGPSPLRGQERGPPVSGHSAGLGELRRGTRRGGQEWAGGSRSEESRVWVCTRSALCGDRRQAALRVPAGVSGVGVRERTARRPLHWSGGWAAGDREGNGRGGRRPGPDRGCGVPGVSVGVVSPTPPHPLRDVPRAQTGRVEPGCKPAV